eukprot:scaffold95864_cov30-Tisochrysis_lutea.AAC.1
MGRRRPVERPTRSFFTLNKKPSLTALIANSGLLILLIPEEGGRSAGMGGGRLLAERAPGSRSAEQSGRRRPDGSLPLASLARCLLVLSLREEGRGRGKRERLAERERGSQGERERLERLATELASCLGQALIRWQRSGVLPPKRTIAPCRSSPTAHVLWLDHCRLRSCRSQPM